VNGVTTEIIQPEGLSNHTPSLKIEWDGAKLGITGTELTQYLLDSRPRIAFARSSGTRPDDMASTVLVTPYMMMPENVKIVADRLYQTLSKPPKPEVPTPLPEGQPAAVNGQWQVKIEFTRGSADHTLELVQNGSDLVGTHYGEYGQGDLKGQIAANLIRFRSSQKIQGTRLFYAFTGTVDGDRMSGDVGLGEYGQAKWSAQRHQYANPSGVVRPVKTPTKI
jgi:L-seryl-tRNA(Ser) seleniumtransferase